MTYPKMLALAVPACLIVGFAAGYAIGMILDRWAD